MKLKSQKGFTLIELLVVISIISLLSSVVLAALNDARARARDARRIEDLRQINNAIQLYLQDHEEAPIVAGSIPSNRSAFTSDDSFGGTWADFEIILSPYIKNLPIDPLNGKRAPNMHDTSSGYLYRYFYRRIDYHADEACTYYSTSSFCNDKRMYVLTANFEKRPRTGDLPISAELFGLTYSGW